MKDLLVQNRRNFHTGNKQILYLYLVRLQKKQGWAYQSYVKVECTSHETTVEDLGNELKPWSRSHDARWTDRPTIILKTML